MRDEDFDKGNPDNVGYAPGQKPTNIKFVGEDRAVVEVDNKPVHWSELPKPVVKEVQDWDFGDRMPDGSDDQEYDKEEEDV